MSAYIFICCVYLEVFTNLFKGQNDSVQRSQCQCGSGSHAVSQACNLQCKSTLGRMSMSLIMINQLILIMHTENKQQAFKKIAQTSVRFVGARSKCYFTSLFRPQNLWTMYFDWITRNLV